MFFEHCETLEDLKHVYKTLVFKHHPDRGGDLETMKAVNVEYEKAFKRLKDAHNKQPEGRKTTETPEEFREIIEKLIILDGLEIELCGSWLWIGGNTKEHREALKAAGCRWSRSKQKWHWHHEEAGARWSRGRSSMNEIRAKYGSQIVESSGSCRRVALEA